MLFWRKFEDKLAALYIQQKIRGFLHLYNGQEAVLAGALHAMDLSKDKMITAYRNHVQPIGMGVDPRAVMAELLGKVTGTSKGMGGSMHIFSKEKGFYGGHGIVGAQIPVGAGIAFADQYFGRDGVTLTYFGDGAARQGSLHEAFNMAMLWKLPVVFIVENNGYAMGTAVTRGSAETHFHRRGTAFRIPGMSVNGMDVIEVRAAAEVAVAHVRSGKGPVLMELHTYRYRGHSMSDPAKYRTREEVQEMREKHDPIDAAKAELLKRGVAEDRLKEIEKQIRSKVNEAADFAENSPEPDMTELYTDVLVESY